MDDFYAEAAARLAAHLDAGRDVVVLAEGDPLFYGSYMHMHKRLAAPLPRPRSSPGHVGERAPSAALGRPLVERDEVLTVLPGTLPAEELAARLAGTDAAAVMKLGRTFPEVRAALAEAGRLDEARYVERATTAASASRRAGRRRPGDGAVLLAGAAARPRPAPARGARRRRGRGRRSAGEVGRSSGSARPGALADPGGAGGAGRRRRPRRLRPLPGPRAAHPRQRRHATRQQGRGRARRVRAGPGRARAAGWRSSPPATRACSRWRPPCWRSAASRSVRRRAGAGAARADRRAGRRRPGRRAARPRLRVLSLSDRLKPWDGHRRRLRAAARPTWCWRSTTRPRGAAPGSCGGPRRCCWSTAPRTPRSWSAATSAAPDERSRSPRWPSSTRQVDMRCLLIVGSSTTRVHARRPVVFTPRRYP